jgi:SAM-dependent methyltransferase
MTDHSGYPATAAARWPLSISTELTESEIAALRRRVDDSAARAQYGWGHTIDFGPFTKEGLLGRAYLSMVGTIDGLEWWPMELEGRTVADVGAYTGGVAALLAARGATTVYAVDELPEHVEQSAIVADAFGLDRIRHIRASLYSVHEQIPEASLDYLFLGGVLYHLSDMLAGLIRTLSLLRPDGWLILDTNAVECMDHSYANFGRFHAGMWWQPTGRCVIDLLEFAGFSDAELVFYRPGRALARGRRAPDARPAFTRGLTIPFDDLRDTVARPMDASIMAPAPDLHAQVGMLRRFGQRAIGRAVSAPLRMWRQLRR